MDRSPLRCRSLLLCFSHLRFWPWTVGTDASLRIKVVGTHDRVCAISRGRLHPWRVLVCAPKAEQFVCLAPIVNIMVVAPSKNEKKNDVPLQKRLRWRRQMRGHFWLSLFIMERAKSEQITWTHIFRFRIFYNISCSKRYKKKTHSSSIWQL